MDMVSVAWLLLFVLLGIFESILTSVSREDGLPRRIIIPGAVTFSGLVLFYSSPLSSWGDWGFVATMLVILAASLATGILIDALKKLPRITIPDDK